MKVLKVLFAIALAAALVIGLLYWRRKHTPPAEIQTIEQTPQLAAEGRLRIYALDVGQGDGLLIVTPAGKAVLIDGGRGEASETVLAKLRQLNIRSIDLAVASHPHSDHIVGLRQVIEQFPVKSLLDSGQRYASAEYERLLAAVKRRNVRFIAAKRAMTFDLDSGIRLEAFNPQGNGQWITDVRSGGSVENANSVVLRLSYADFAMVFTGDAEFETEALLLKSEANLRAQVLKVGHHGSRYATSGKFLDRIRPEAAIISCGADNRYSHPAQTTLDRLRKANVNVHRTDLSGEIAIISDGRTYQVLSHRQADLKTLWVGRIGLEELATARAGKPRPGNEERD
ncbi:MAG: ComEC/Rec2 family competence protein [Blastocatellia bacterium]|nr:ComEC/Rec2 family competence protein [Blastocatellia bacterium]